MDAPAPYKTAAICNIVSGAFNILYGLSFLVLLVGIIPLGIGVWQIMVGMKMNNGEKEPNAKTALMAGMAGILFCNLISLIASGYGYTQVGQDEVVGWLEG